MLSMKDLQFETLDILIKDIAFGVRSREVYKNIPELADNIEKLGQIQPISVRRISNNDKHKYELICGGRRLTAYQYLQTQKPEFTTIRAEVYPEETSELHRLSMEFWENQAREALNPAETCRNITLLQDKLVATYGKKTGRGPKAPGITCNEVAQLMNISPADLSRKYKIGQFIKMTPDFDWSSFVTMKELEQCVDKLSQANERQIKNDRLSAALDKHKSTIITLEEADLNQLPVIKGKKLDDNSNKNTETTQLITSSEVKTKIESNSTDQKQNMLLQELKKLIDSYKLGDTLAMLKEIPTASVDFTETDSPYGIDLVNKQKQFTQYLEWSSDDYMTIKPLIYKELYRIHKEKTWGLTWFAINPWFSFEYQWILEAGFKCNGMPMIWCKDRGRTNSPLYNLARGTETFFYFRKGAVELPQQGGLDYILEPIGSTKDRVHITAKPLNLYTRLFNIFAPSEGSMVIPFAGNGNSLLAGYKHGLDVLGFDLIEDYRNNFILNAKDLLGVII